MSNDNRIESLDSLRGIASLVVVIFHCLISFPVFNAANYKNHYENKFVEFFTITPLHTIWAGNEAVLLFFILSGFVLSIPFLNHQTQSYSNYVIKRIFRIYFPYILIMLFSSLLVTIFANFQEHSLMSQTYNNRWEHPVTIKAILSYIIMFNYDTNNVNGVVWTLYHEMRISFIFPFIMLIIIRFDWKKSLLLTLGLVSLGYYVTEIILSTSFGILSGYLGSFRDTFYYAIFFIFGTLLSKYKNNISDYFIKVNSLKKCLIFILSLLLINQRWMHYFVNIKYSIVNDLIVATGILLLFSLVLNSERLKSVLTRKPLLFLGKISYSLYLVHIPVMMMLNIYLSNVVPFNLTFIFVPFVSILVAYFCHMYIEVTCIKLGKKVTKSIGKIYVFKKVYPLLKHQQKKSL